MSKLRERLNLTKKAEEVHSYKFQSPIKLHFYGEYDEIDSNDLTVSPEFEGSVADAVTMDMDELGAAGLAEYLDEPLKSVVTSIIVTVQNCRAVTMVDASRELTSEELEQVKEYISGQFSDGWGEGFEQNAIDQFDYEDDEEYEEDGYTETETVEKTGDVAASFWDSRNWDITLM